ncbi:ring-cleaving dioxygenase [Priestia koreensis]|uniref:Ring-cleaving dioxygenase n=1 Tax=Priestia koreensis TaxID=284581 RepID=A0A0M0L565_9BACI|nr:ring-cleaving dioxygenase [Priestia koreensis]KOO46220.1 ring-cleaving dioxygenase [Priestia koreensis]
MRTAGIHHISAIVGHPQENVDFYAGILGLRMIKKTINFDDPGTYHLYFGDEAGTPGTIMTFFPWPKAISGRIGTGQVGVTTFVVPAGSLPFWKKRLETFEVAVKEEVRFNENTLSFEDPHGLRLEIVAREGGENSTWSFGNVTPNVAIKGFGGATLLSAKPNETAHLLEHVLGLTRIGEENGIIRFQSEAAIGNIIDIQTDETVRGLAGAGTVHHIAWRAQDNAEHEKWREHVTNSGYHVTPVKDRNYFNAIYFKEHGNILFEIATDPPGFSIDEQVEKLGEKLMLPEWYEEQREKIEEALIPITVKELENE